MHLAEKYNASLWFICSLISISILQSLLLLDRKRPQLSPKTYGPFQQDYTPKRQYYND